MTSTPAAPVVSTAAVYPIATAAQLCGMHPQTLRTWERLGFVVPARSCGGQRRYSDADLVTVRRVVELSAHGVSLAGIARILELESENRRLTNELAARS
jgi:MerR family transcriptional regulator, heat shock protein HspR